MQAYRAYSGTAPAPTLPPAVTTGVLVANRGWYPNNVQNFASNITSRVEHTASPQGDVTNIKAVDVGSYISQATWLAVAQGTHVFKRYLEYPAGVFHQVLWSAAAALTVTAGVVHMSDVIVSSVTGLPLIIPAGSMFWDRTVHITGSAKNIPIMQLPATATALGLSNGKIAADQGNSGVIAADASDKHFGASAFVGDVAAANARSFWITGDSIADGTGDITGVGAKGGSGWIARALDPLYPYVKFTQGGQQSDHAATNMGFAAPTNFKIACGITDVICEYGINDLRVGRTSANIQTSLQTIYSAFPGARKYQSTITTRTDSTDAYATVANQTTKTDGNMAELTAHNNAIRAGLAQVTSVLEIADITMSARDSNVWKCPAGATPPVTDGTHPTTPMAAYIASNVVIP